MSFRKTNFKKGMILNPEMDKFSSINIKVPGLTSIGVSGLSFNTELMPIANANHYFTKPNQAFLDYDKTGSDIKVRFFCPGDRFLPLGMKGSKKLKSFFI